MPVKPLSLYTHYHACDYYSLRIKRNKIETKIIMSLQNELINTRDLPQTLTILKKMLPTVLQSICYNEQNYPFCKEVLKTEVGHLFEHILIEYLCLMKVDRGCENAEYSGITKWNWRQYPMGSFHITINSGIEDNDIFTEAMTKSISLLNIILLSGLNKPAVDPVIISPIITPIQPVPEMPVQPLLR